MLNRKLKDEIKKMKNKLATAFDIDSIVKIENDIKVCQDELESLNDTNAQMLKVSKNQTMAMDDLNKEEEVNIRLSKINGQIRDNKKIVREIQYNILKYQKIEKQQHSAMCLHEEYFRQMRDLITIHKNNQVEKRKEQIQETVKENLQQVLTKNASKAADGEKVPTKSQEAEKEKVLQKAPESTQEETQIIQTELSEPAEGPNQKPKIKPVTDPEFEFVNNKFKIKKMEFDLQEQIEEAKDEEEIIRKYMQEIDQLQKSINQENTRLEKKKTENEK